MAANSTECNSKISCCLVCGSSAGKHNYYGARTCISCRGFFRRSVQSQQYHLFVCSTDSTCNLESKSRKCCKKCRFEKCLNIGMRPSWVLTPEERCQRMLQRSKKKVILKEPSIKITYFTPEETKQVAHLHDLTIEIFTRLYYRIYASEMDVMRSSLKHSFDGRPFSYAEVKLIEDMDSFAVKELIFKMFELHNIQSSQDVKILAKHNVSRLIGLYQALVWKQCDFDYFMHQFISYGMANRQHSNDVNRVLTVIEDLHLSENSVVYNYDILYSSPWASHIEYEEKHRSITKKINSWLKSNEMETIDKTQLILITMAMAFCTEGLIVGQLSNFEAIEKTQLKYLNMLHRYLKDKFPENSRSKLAQGMFIITEAQEAHEIHMNRLPI